MSTVTERTCAMEGCERAQECRGYCGRHYRRLRMQGRLAITPRRRCSVAECDEAHYALGYCAVHYSRVKKRGRADAPPPDALLPGEVWKPVPGLHGRYEASSMGRLRWVGGFVATSYPGKIVAGVTKSGYLVIRPYPRPDRRIVGVHRLVACAFLGPCPEGLEVNHIDGDPSNNHPGNLEYVTHRENVRHAFREGLVHHKLTAADARRIRRRVAAGGDVNAVAADFGVTPAMVANIARGRAWSYV